MMSEYISNIMMSYIVPVIGTYSREYYIGYWIQQRILYWVLCTLIITVGRALSAHGAELAAVRLE